MVIRQVPKYTGHTDGGFVEGTKVGSWPIVRVGILDLNDSSRFAKEPFNSRYGSPLWQLTQLLDGADANQGAHLRDRDGVELCQSLRCYKPLMDQNRVDALHIG